LQALARRPTLIKLGLRRYPLGLDNARLLRMALCNIPSLQSLVLKVFTLGSAELAELAPALYHNRSIKELDMSYNRLDGMDSAEILRNILRSNETMIILDLSGNKYGQTAGAVDCITDGLGSTSMLLKIDLTSCALRDDGVSVLAQTLGSRNTTLQKLALGCNPITSTGADVLLETSFHITDLDLWSNPIGNEGASLLARSLGNNALPKFTCLFHYNCYVGDDGVIALVSALEPNTSLLHLDLRQMRHSPGFSERAFLALAESLPEIKVLQRLALSWCTGLALVMPLLLAGLRKNTSLFRVHITDCAPSSAPPTTEETVQCAGGWMQEMVCLGNRNRFLTFTHMPEETLPPLGVWPHALTRVAIPPDVIFEVLRSKPSLVPAEDKGGKEATKDTGVSKKRMLGDE
jgi:hypothetical protein